MTTASAAVWRPSPERSIGVSIAWALRDIKLAHTVFALPFAVLGAFLANSAADESQTWVWPAFLGQLGLIVVCMFFARTWAMLVNRIADRRFDAANQRTARRALASGQLDSVQAAVVACAAAAGFMIACCVFWLAFRNPWPALLSIPALGWIAQYSFMKRFTWLSHVFLGGALAASPIAAAIAVEPSSLTSTPALWLIAAMVLMWVAGFDALYALQDLEFDREVGLHSMPARFGWRGAVWISRGLHALAVVALVAAWRLEPRFGWLFGVAVLGTAALLVIEHVVIARRGLDGMPMAFFTVNGIVSCLLGAVGSVDVIV